MELAGVRVKGEFRGALTHTDSQIARSNWAQWLTIARYIPLTNMLPNLGERETCRTNFHTTNMLALSPCHRLAPFL